MLDLAPDCPETLRHEAAAADVPGRMAPAHTNATLLALMLDEVDYGMLLLDEDGGVMHANHGARHEIAAGHPLRLDGRLLSARLPAEAAMLSETLQCASHRNMRGLLHLGTGAGAVSVAVVPLAEVLPGGARPTLVMLGKRALCERLSVQWFARSHLLTPAETRVLEGLCDGASPNEIAEAQAVAISTVRTQIGSIRTKTGVGSIRALVRRVGLLPPLVTALRRLLPH